MFGMTNPGRSRSDGMNPFQELEQITAGLFHRAPKLDFELDVKDEGDAFVLEADLPGIKREDLDVALEGDYLTISAQRGTRQCQQSGDHYIRRERSCGRVCRTFDVSEVDTDAISASYQAGVLSLRLPKKEPAGDSARHLEIQ